jgi:peptide/nickel transport system permease protein
VAALQAELGLDEPLPTQYGRWLWSMVNGEFGGRSLLTREPLREVVARRCPVTMLLGLYAISLALLVAVPLGAVAAAPWRRRRTC